MDKILMKEAFEVIIRDSSDMVFLKDANLVYHAASVPFAKMVGKKSPEESDFFESFSFGSSSLFFLENL